MASWQLASSNSLGEVYARCMTHQVTRDIRITEGCSHDGRSKLLAANRLLHHCS
jgi:hypothetical protein